ncbi:MAG TPA: RluA family pseudouridine synthase [Spirochaetia bacterium]|nr:RluA family pseudouridine synthase [Spirochaetia bacterium]
MSKERPTYQQFPIGKDDIGRRLDRLVRKFLNGQSLGTIYGAIRRGDIRVNGAKAKGDYRVTVGDRIYVLQGISPEPTESPPKASLELALPAWFRGSILIENDHLIALNKPAGVLVHGNSSLQTAVLEYLLPTQDPSLSFTPGPLHRLDRNTSGIILFGKSITGSTRFTSLLRSHSIEKRYLVLLQGRLTGEATWVDRLSRNSGAKKTVESDGGREVTCHVEPLSASDRATLALVSMRSGFTHQIRAQAALHSHPLAGDKKYGALPARGLVLHACSLKLDYHDTVLGFRTLAAPVPPESLRLLREYFEEKHLHRVLEGI